MPFVNPTTPNLADFLTFLADTVQIPVAALPANSPYPGYALNQAIALVLNPSGAMFPGVTFPPGAGYPGVMYSLACYNCATHLLFVITPDQDGQTYFKNARGNNSSSDPPGFGLNAPSTGLVVSSSDQGTSAGLAEPKWAKGLTVSQLGYYKTPWGREYLSWQQSYGPTIVGLS
jgi:hypothetical protein